MRPDLTELARLLDYNAEAGTIIRKPRPREDFDNLRAFRMWTARFARVNAVVIHATGQRVVFVAGCVCSATEVAFALHHSRWSTADYVVSLDGTLRADSLIETTHALALRHCRPRRRGQAEQTGIRAHRGRWEAFAQQDGRQVWLGTYASRGEALAARSEAVSGNYLPR